MICSTKAMTVSPVLLPYGRRAVSPKYTIDSAGATARRARTTVNPPKPLSTTMMGERVGTPSLSCGAGSLLDNYAQPRLTL